MNKMFEFKLKTIINNLKYEIRKINGNNKKNRCKNIYISITREIGNGYFNKNNQIEKVILKEILQSLINLKYARIN